MLLFFSYSGLQLSWNNWGEERTKSIPSGREKRVLGVKSKVEVFSGQGLIMNKVQVDPGRVGSEWRLVGVREWGCYLPIN